MEEKCKKSNNGINENILSHIVILEFDFSPGLIFFNENRNAPFELTIGLLFFSKLISKLEPSVGFIQKSFAK